MAKINILGLGGSVNPGSPTTQALALSLQGARDAGAEVRCLDVQTLASWDCILDLCEVLFVDLVHVHGETCETRKC